MTQKNETLPLLISLLITAGLIGGGYWWLTRKSGLQISFGSNNSSSTAPTPSASAPNPPASPPNLTPSSPQTSQANEFTASSNAAVGSVIRLDGSTSMVHITQALKRQFESQSAGTQVQTAANGSQQGINGLLAGTVDLAATSR